MRIVRKLTVSKLEHWLIEKKEFIAHRCEHRSEQRCRIFDQRDTLASPSFPAAVGRQTTRGLRP